MPIHAKNDLKKQSRGGARHGSGRKPIGDTPMIQRNISLPRADWEALDVAALAAGQTRSELIREQLRPFFENIKSINNSMLEQK